MTATTWNYLLRFCVVTASCCCLRSDVNTFGVRPDIPAIADYFTTKGRYEEVNPHLRDDILSVNGSALQPPSTQCRQAHLTAIIRHGTRYPSSKNVKKMQQLYEIVKTSARGEEYWLREIQGRWTMWYTEDMDGRLAPKGVLDHKRLAVRLSKLFPSVLSEEKLRGGFVQFMTSSKHRCVNSTLAFKTGLTELWAITGTSSIRSSRGATEQLYSLKCLHLVSRPLPRFPEMRKSPYIAQKKPCRIYRHDPL